MATTRCVPRYPFCHWVRSPHGMNPKPSTSPIARIIDLVGQINPQTWRDLQGYQIMHIRNQPSLTYISSLILSQIHNSSDLDKHTAKEDYIG